MNILDINSNSIKFNRDVQKNLKYLVKKFGRNFIIKDGEVHLPAVIELDTKTSMKYYIIYYDIYERDEYLLPFKLDFVDKCLFKLNNNCYIAQLTKTDKVSGTEMVKIILKFLKKIHVKRATLSDDSSIKCGDGNKLGLSYFKLIQKQETFYHRFGFRYLLKCAKCKDFYNKLTTQHAIKTFLNGIVTRIKEIKLQDLIKSYQKILNIMIYAIRNRLYEEVSIVKEYNNGALIYTKSKNKDRLHGFIRDYKKILKVLGKLKDKYDNLYDVMVNTFSTDCKTYLFIYDYVIYYYLSGIRFRNHEYKITHRQPFDDLYKISELSLYVDL